MKVIPFASTRGCRSYLVVDEASTEAALIDPSEEIALTAYLSALAGEKARLRYVIETHTHADHISSAPAVVQKTGAQMLRHAKAPSPTKDLAAQGGERVPLGETTLAILATPGHTDESISVRAGSAVFTGDALLIGGNGRTDFQGGDSSTAYDSLHSVLGTLPDETVVYPAHDYAGRFSSTIGEEKRTNARFALGREAFVTAMDAHHPPKPELFETAIAINSQ